MKRYSFLFCLFLIFVLYRIGFADTLYLKNGTQIVGKTISQDPEKVIFRIGEGQDTLDLTFFSEEVLRIDKTDVSNVIELPFVKGKGIKFPRPVLKDVPFIANQTIAQEEEQVSELKTKEIQSQPALDHKQQAEMPPKDFLSDSDKEILLKQQKVIEELLPLLTKEESDYFMYINSTAGIVLNKTMSFVADLLTNLPTQLLDSSKPMESIKELSTETDSLINNLIDLKPPDIFVNFHKKYLKSLTLIKEVFQTMSLGNELNPQTRQQIKDIDIELLQELEKILEEKKKEGKEL